MSKPETALQSGQVCVKGTCLREGPWKRALQARQTSAGPYVQLRACTEGLLAEFLVQLQHSGTLLGAHDDTRLGVSRRAGCTSTGN
jgi:hypothetical protein